PMPAVAHASLPGSAFAAATKSATFVYFPGGVMSTVGMVATVATGVSSFGSRPGLSSVETVKAEAYIMMVWPSGSCPATHFAPTRPPAPSRFSTITGWPRVVESFSARMRAIVSDALPGVTPETKRTVLLGNGDCGHASVATHAVIRKTARLLIAPPPNSLLDPGKAELRGEPVCAPASIAVGSIVRIMAAILDHEELDGSRHALRQPLGVGRRHQAILASGDDEERTGDLSCRIAQRQRRGILLRLRL